MSADKEFRASDTRRADEKKKGNFPQSQELNAAAQLLFVGATLAALFGWLKPKLVGLVVACFQSRSLGELQIADVTVLCASVVLPLFVALLGAALLTTLSTRRALGLYPLKFEIQRLDPLRNIQQKWLKPEALVMPGLTVLKFGFVFVVGAIPFLRLVTSSSASSNLLHDASGLFGFWLLGPASLAFVVAGLADYGWRVWRYERDIRMSHHDLKEEQKSDLGDPRLRSARRRRHREISRSRDIAAAKEATVLVVNPEHFAVALRYDPGVDAAPVLLGKGVDKTAELMRRAARQSKVPIVRKAPVARAIYHSCRRGQTIPKSLYRAVAIILAALKKNESRR